MRKLTKTLSVLVVVAMAVCMLIPVTAFADDSYVAEVVGGGRYDSLQAAIDAAEPDDTVRLLSDITLAPQTISGESAKYGAYITKNLTIDGAGYVITSNAERAIGVKGVSGNVDVTFVNVTINDSVKSAICICTRGGIGTLTLDGVTLNTQGCPSGYNQPLTIGGTQYTQAEVVVKDSLIQTNDDASKYYAIILWNPVDLTIVDSTIKGWACVYQKPFETGTVDETVVSIDNSTLVSKGIKGSSNHFAAIMTEEAGFNCEVTNTDINVTAAEGTYQGIAAAKYGVSGFDVDLGEGNHVILTGDTALIGYNFDDEANEIAVSGGTFNVPVATYYCADGYVPVDNGDGTYGVDGPYAAKIGDTTYETLAAALNAANDGDTVEVLADTSISTGSSSSSRFAITKSMTIDGNGKTVTINNRGFGVGMGAESDVDVTFKDINITNNSNGGRCIDTRGNIGSLTLDGVTLYTAGTSGYLQPLTIGGNQATVADVTINNSTIMTSEEGTKGYAIITFNPVNATITDSTIKGWACVYAKGPDGSAGSAGSVYNIDNSTLVSKNINTGSTNDFGMIAVETNDITVNITNSDIVLDGEKNDQALLSLDRLSRANVAVNLGEGNDVQFLNDGATFGINQGETAIISITGGTFNFDPTACVAAGYLATDNGDGTYTVENNDLITGYSIATEAYVDLSFYIDNTAITPETVATSDTVVTFEWANGTASTDVEVGDLTENGFKATLPDLPAAEMTMPVTATISVDGEVVGVSDAYSVRDYAMQVISDPTSEPELVNLVENMLVYGAAAQAVFNVEGTGAADEFIDLDLADIDAADIDEAIADANGGLTSSDLNEVAAQLGGDFYTTSLIFLSGNTLRHYFTGNGLNKAAFDGNKANYYYYVEKVGIAADKLDELQEFNVGGVTFYYSALDYVKGIINTAAEGSAAYNLAVATYMYNQAANLYF